MRTGKMLASVININIQNRK